MSYCIAEGTKVCTFLFQWEECQHFHESKGGKAEGCSLLALLLQG